MPVELLPKRKVLGGEDYVYDKRLFDRIGVYIPLEDTNIKGGYFQHWKDRWFVHVDSSSSRMANSVYQRKKVIYHEYGHATHWVIDKEDNADIANLMKKSKKRLKEAEWQDIDKQLENLWYSTSSKDEEEQIMGVMDTVQALTKGKHGCKNIDGHSKKGYWSEDNHPQDEFVAHMSENVYLGNDIFKKILP